MLFPVKSNVHPIPEKTGIGLRFPHYQEIQKTLPQVGFLEVHSENFFGPGGHPLHLLKQLCEHYPISLHGVGLFLGSTDPLCKDHLNNLQTLISKVSPFLVSEHLCWGSAGGRFVNDLLPLPYTEESLHHICSRIDQAQEFLGQQILIENVSSYLEYRHSTIPEWEFIAEMTRRTQCGLLLDINNIYVNSVNHDFDPAVYFAAVPWHSVKEIHLAGFDDSGQCLIDTHAKPVSAPVWDLLRCASRWMNRVPILIEWDADLPSLHDLLEEANKADRIWEEIHAHSM